MAAWRRKDETVEAYLFIGAGGDRGKVPKGYLQLPPVGEDGEGGGAHRGAQGGGSPGDGRRAVRVRPASRPQDPLQGMVTPMCSKNNAT